MSSNPDPGNSEGKKPAARQLEDATRFSTDAGSLSDDQDFDLADPPNGGNSSISLLGEYLLLEQIGAGGMGQVYRAEHRTMNRQVALKVLNSAIGHPKLIEQFFAEIRAVAKLMHPNIVTAFDAGSVGQTHFLVMELVEGEVLSSRIRRLGPLSCGEAVHVLEQAARALHYAHSQGIVHRDIKPSNMMLTTDGTLKILDFGLARLGTAEATESNANIFMGTPEYMSPEQIEHADKVDGRSDLYSLGATLFYLLTGRSMFSGEKIQVAISQIRQKPPALFLARNDIDLRLDAIFQRLVEKKPANRYASGQALLDNLHSLSLTSSPAIANMLSKGAGRLGDSPTSVALSRSTLTKKSQIVAIDLGTLASTAAYYDKTQGPQVVHQGEGNAHHLRNMVWSSSEQIKFGSSASAMRQHASQQVIHSVQRWIGATQLPQTFCGEQVPPEVVLAAILRQLMHNSAAVTDNASSAIVTVPGCYDQVHRRAIRDACRIAGIDLIQLLDKPLAGALSWLDVNARLQQSKSASKPMQAKLLFAHLGGSGLEAAVLQVDGSAVEQLGLHGNWKLGSLRWQNRLAEYFAGMLKEQTGKSIRDDVHAATRLQRSVELAMERLTRSSKVEVRFEWSSATIQQTVTQQGLVKIAPGMVSDIQRSVSLACQMAKIDPTDIDHILFSGSMMRMKPVQEIVRGVVPRKVEATVLDKADFARGAALHAHYLTGLTQRDTSDRPRAISRSAYAFGLLVASRPENSLKPRILMEESSQLPTACTRTLRPQPATQAGRPAFASLQIIESTSLGGSNWHLLAKTKPDEIFPERNGDDVLQLRFEVDESGILRPSLMWPTGNRQVLLPTCIDSAISEADISKWNHWLDTAMLCSTN